MDDAELTPPAAPVAPKPIPAPVVTKPAEAPVPVRAVAMSLRDFCQAHAAGQVELTHAFSVQETRAHRVKDTEANYSARLAAFAKQPA